MDTGCPQCTKIQKKRKDSTRLCLAHQLEQAEYDSLRAMTVVEEIRKQIEREKDVSTSKK